MYSLADGPVNWLQAASRTSNSGANRDSSFISFSFDIDGGIRTQAADHSVVATAGAVDHPGLSVCEEPGISLVRQRGELKEIWMPLATGADFPAAVHARRIPGSALNSGFCGRVLVQAGQ